MLFCAFTWIYFIQKRKNNFGKDQNVKYVLIHSLPRRWGPKPEEAPLESTGVYIQGQRIFVEKVRNVFVMGEAFSV